MYLSNPLFLILLTHWLYHLLVIVLLNAQIFLILYLTFLSSFPHLAFLIPAQKKVPTTQILADQ